MPRAIHRLSARAAETISKLGRHADGGGLYLSISDGGRRRWVFLYTWRGKTREAGLGAAGKGGVSLKDAREKAAQGRSWVKEGVDPIARWLVGIEKSRRSAKWRTTSLRLGALSGAIRSTRPSGR